MGRDKEVRRWGGGGFGKDEREKVIQLFCFETWLAERSKQSAKGLRSKVCAYNTQIHVNNK